VPPLQARLQVSFLTSPLLYARFSHFSPFGGVGP
jgi:hypothetical protein